MYFLALATDYDGTLAHDGVVDRDTVAAIWRLKNSGRRLILVIGRELPELKRACPEFTVCDLIVAENGAVPYEPGTGRETVLAPAPPEAFVARLRERGVHPLSVGRSIVASWEPMQDIVLETVRELGASSCRPCSIRAPSWSCPRHHQGERRGRGAGRMRAVTAQRGRHRRCREDHAFLAECGCSVAVANALDSIKAEADLVTRGARGEGVRELIEQLLATDLADVVRASERHRLPIGAAAQDEMFFLRPKDGNLLVAGISGGGKSTLVAGVLERLAERGFQLCVIDPEGDYPGDVADAEEDRRPRQAVHGHVQQAGEVGERSAHAEREGDDPYVLDRGVGEHAPAASVQPPGTPSAASETRMGAPSSAGLHRRTRRPPEGRAQGASTRSAARPWPTGRLRASGNRFFTFDR